VPPPKRAALATASAVFESLGPDRDGYVSRSALLGAFRRDPHLERVLGHHWAAVADQIDSDHDGRISWAELKHYMLHHSPATKAVYVPKEKALLLHRLREAFGALLAAADSEKKSKAAGGAGDAKSSAPAPVIGDFTAGRVSKAMFFTALRTHPEMEELCGSHWAEAFGAMDTDADGLISFQEFRDFMFARTPVYLPPTKQALRHRALELFTAADTNGDGYLTRAELFRYLKAHSELERELGESWKNIWIESDANGDERVSFPEFEHFLFFKSRHSAASVHGRRRTGSMQTGASAGAGAGAGAGAAGDSKAASPPESSGKYVPPHARRIAAGRDPGVGVAPPPEADAPAADTVASAPTAPAAAAIPAASS
jgi:Ca2+-binding EF-hand superfamily protein